MNICIMLEYGSNFSLGVITSLFSIGSIFVILFMTKFTKPGKRTWLFTICAILPIIASIIFVIKINQFTVVLLNGIVMVTAIVYKVLFDAHRNSNLKEAGLYNQISEHLSIVDNVWIDSYFNIVI